MVDAVLVAVPLSLMGLLALAAPIQWRRGRWVPAGRWLVRVGSPHVVVALPAIGIFTIALGLSFLWPVLVVPAVMGAGLAVWVMTSSSRDPRPGSGGRLPRGLREHEGSGPPSVRTGPESTASAPAAVSPSNAPRSAWALSRRWIHGRGSERRAG
jgi:hypothetical protein